MPIRDLSSLVNAGRRAYTSLADLMSSDLLRDYGRNTSMWGALSAPVERMTPEQQRTLRNTAVISGMGAPLIGPVASGIDAGLMALPETAGNLGQLMAMAAGKWRMPKVLYHGSRDVRAPLDIEQRAGNYGGALFTATDPYLAESFGPVYEITPAPGLRTLNTADKAAVKRIAREYARRYADKDPGIDAGQLAEELTGADLQENSHWDSAALQQTVADLGYGAVRSPDGEVVQLLRPQESIAELRSPAKPKAGWKFYHPPSTRLK